MNLDCLKIFTYIGQPLHQGGFYWLIETATALIYQDSDQEKFANTCKGIMARFVSFLPPHRFSLKTDQPACFQVPQKRDDPNYQVNVEETANVSSNVYV